MLEYYIEQSPTSNPGHHADLFAELPTDLPGIAQVVQGLVYHYMAGPYLYG